MSENKTNEAVAQKTEKVSFMDYVRVLGPGLVVSAVVIGPGSVTTASSMGANYAYQGLWLVLFACIASYFFQETAVRIVVHQKETVLSGMKHQLAPWVAKLICVLAFVMTMMAQAGNFVGAGMAMNYFVPALSVNAWACILIVLGLVMVFLKKDGLLDGFTKTLVFIMAVTFIITAVATHPSMSRIVGEGFSFRIPGGQIMLALGLVGTTIVPDTPLALSTLNQDKYWSPEGNLYGYSVNQKEKFARVDLIVSLIVTFLITSSIIICSATVLNPQGIKITAAADMAIQLTPILGRFAGILFSLGLWSAAFSSGSYRIQLMPKYFLDAFSLEGKTATTVYNVVALLAGVVPFLMLMIYSGNPVQLVIAGQVSVGLLVPFVAIALFILMNKKSYMGEHANNLGQNIAFLVVIAVTLGMAARTFINLIK